MNRKIYSFIICFLLMLPSAAFAEEKGTILKLEELSIQVMPEFAAHPKDGKKEEPTLLTGYQGTLINKSEKAQKGQIEIPLPVNEKNFRIGFVADYSSDLSEMHEIEYELDMEKGTILWKTSREIEPNDLYKFVIEFYSDSLKTKKDERTLRYSFKSFVDTGLVTITVLEPIKSSASKLEPVADTEEENSYGLKMFSYQAKEMKAGEEKKFTYSYKRSETKTTSELLEESGGHTGAPAKELKVEKIPVGLTIAGISAASLLAAGLILLFLKRRKAQALPIEGVEVDENDLKIGRLRKMLHEGTISENEYNELHKKLKIKN